MYIKKCANYKLQYGSLCVVYQQQKYCNLELQHIHRRSMGEND